MTETQVQTITITVDGKSIEARPGEVLIAAAERAGIFVPRFCWHKRMEPVGACRMCLVDVEGSPMIPGTSQRRPQTSCTTVVRDGMVAHTQFTSEDIRADQKSILELLLINHPLDCPICDRAGECPLQDQAVDYGDDDSRFIEPKRRFPKPIPISPLVNLDRERCILCFRCTRFCEEISGDVMIGTMQRGSRSYIYPFEGDTFDSYFSGNTIEICPVGALTSAPYRFQARPWDLAQTPSVCNLCSAGCNVNLSVRVADGKLVRASQFTNEDVNEEWLCDKGRFGHSYVSSPSRLTEPWVRVNGELIQASWDEAFAAITARIAPNMSSAMIVGAHIPDEDAYVASKFARLVLRTNSVDYRCDDGPSDGSLIGEDLTYADVLAAPRVVLVGLDPREEVPMLFLRLRTAASKGRTKVAIVHPVRVALSELADVVAQPLPGTYGAVAAALAAALGSPFAGEADPLRTEAALSDSSLASLAEAMSEEGTVVLVGSSVAARPNHALAWSKLCSDRGIKLAWVPRRANEKGVLRSGAHCEFLPGLRPVSSDAARAEVGAFWGSEVPSSQGLSAVDSLRRAAVGELDVLWLVGADVLDVPDSRLGADALYNAKFVVLQGVMSDDQVEFADVILPAAAYGERDGTITNWEGRRQLQRRAVNPAGSARADFAILSEAARRLGCPIGCGSLTDVRIELEGMLADAHMPKISGDMDFAARFSDRPLRLETYRLLYDSGSRVSKTPEIGELTPAAFVEMHSSDSSAAGLVHGDEAYVETDHGSIRVNVVTSDRVKQGVVFVPYSQPGTGGRELVSITDPSPYVTVGPA